MNTGQALSKTPRMLVGDLEEEQWKPIYHPNASYSLADRYMVSNFGRVKRLSFIKQGRNKHGPISFEVKEKVMSLRRSSDGYFICDISRKIGDETKKFLFQVHRLVAYAFVDMNPPDGYQVNHINGIKTDNRPCNLEWVSVKQNVQHSYDLGLACNSGDRHPIALLSNEEVRRLRYLHNVFGYTSKQIQEAYGLKKNTVNKMLRRLNYRSVV